MSDNDPRLRILDPAAGTLAEPILAALDGTAVLVHLGSDVTGSARVAAAALAAMAARLFGRIEIRTDVDAGAVLPPNWWGAADIPTLATRAAQLITPQHSGSTRTITVTVGTANTGGADFGIGGDDYTAHIARSPVAVRPGAHHLGVHAAACLAISQILGLILREHGLRVVELDEDYRLDLLTHRPGASHSGDTHAKPADSATDNSGAWPSPSLRELVFAGAGSVGSSAIALTATALAPAFTGGTAPPDLTIDVVDLDRFDPNRNPFRYPALLGGETQDKASALAAQLRSAGLDATGYTSTVGTWTVQRERPGVRGVLVSSVDTLTGRLEVADVLAETTLSIGVSGLLLHAQRERMDGSAACPFCDYVDTAPTMTQADVYVDLTGLDLQRVLQLLDGNSPLTDVDVSAAVSAGKLRGQQAFGLAGHRLQDLVNRVYAEGQIRSSTGATLMTVAFPQVSWFAGVLTTVELVKQIQALPVLYGRVDVDLAGLPPGALRVMPPDPTGRCVCHSGVRRRAYSDMYTAARHS